MRGDELVDIHRRSEPIESAHPTAWCDTCFQPPGADCDCGLYVMETADAAIELALAWRRNAADLAESLPWLDLDAFHRARYGEGVAIVEVLLEGRVRRSRSPGDPPGSWRAQRLSLLAVHSVLLTDDRDLGGRVARRYDVPCRP